MQAAQLLAFLPTPRRSIAPPTAPEGRSLRHWAAPWPRGALDCSHVRAGSWSRAAVRAFPLRGAEPLDWWIGIAAHANVRRVVRGALHAAVSPDAKGRASTYSSHGDGQPSREGTAVSAWVAPPHLAGPDGSSELPCPARSGLPAPRCRRPSDDMTMPLGRRVWSGRLVVLHGPLQEGFQRPRGLTPPTR